MFVALNKQIYILKKNALAGNRTQASRVAGENSTIEPPVPYWPTYFNGGFLVIIIIMTKKMQKM